MHRMILNETSYFGAGCRESIAIEAKRRGFKKAFFVTDKDLIAQTGGIVQGLSLIHI